MSEFKEYKVGEKIVYHSLPYSRLFYVKAVLNDSIVVRECWGEAGAKSFSEFPPYADIRHATHEEIAAGRRIDKSLLQKHLDGCAEVVKTWPKWKVDSVRKAFGIPDLGDDSHIETTSAHCVNQRMFEMDKKALQEQFEAVAAQNCWNINKYPAGWDGHSDDEYADDFVCGAWWGFQHQQAKVEELQKRVDAVKGLAQILWGKSNEKHEQGKVWESKTLGECADEILDVLEQALKGGEA